MKEDQIISHLERLHSQALEQTEQINQKFQLVQESLGRVETELALIKKDVVYTKNVVLSKFAGIEAQDKETLENLIDAFLEDELVVEEINGLLTNNPVMVRKGSKTAVKKYPVISLKMAIIDFFGSFHKSDYRREVGKFIAEQMRLISKVDYNGLYPRSASQLIAHMAFFYQEKITRPTNKKDINKLAERIKVG